jgi:protein-S-isoprenylcysteine O-methyltransferase Ste14
MPAYGHWPVVMVYSLVLLIFVFSFFRPRTRRDWRTFGTFSAFVIALFTEMYGFPLTVYLLSGWLGSRYPEVDWFSHNAGHLWQTLLGLGSSTHFGLLHIISDMLIVGGLVLLAVSWKVLFKAQQNHELAVTGPYARVRHPQYAAFMVIMFGFLVQWPTLPTLVMFPVLVWIYVRLARREEKEAMAEFGEEYARYVENTPRFFPDFGEAQDLWDSRDSKW